ncbi:Pep3/Vps18/deep orange family-domain-containing protein [Circinella umbellata]|nr:Pep3/Vps18/deep orange family-domain-containing protein [Circinella umbellata]
MSLIDDFNESSETSYLPASVSFGDTHLPQNGYAAGFESADNVRLETGYVSISSGFGQTEIPIFALNYVQFQLPARLVDMVVSNDILIMAVEPARILRINLDRPLEVEEIEITRKPGDGKIVKMFFDPTGRHLIITTDHGENFYLYEKWRRAKQLSKLKGVTISSIAWNKQATLTDPSTREILIGTRNGLIYETCLEPTDEFFRKEEKYFKQVYSIHESTMPITGLHFEQFPVNNRKYFVMATTPTRIYQFVGYIGPSSAGTSRGSPSFVESDDRGERAMFESMFSKYDVNPGFQELPGELSYSELHFFSRFYDLQQQGVAQTFAWLTGPGIYHGDLIFGSQNVGDSVIDNVQLLQYPATPSEDESSKLVTEIPISVAITEFHFILLYKDRIRAVCQLNDQIVYEEMIPTSQDEEVVGMVVDDIKRTFWIYTTFSIYELSVENEERDVWKLYLEKSQYDMALQYCKDPAQKDKVYTAQAKDYFSQRRYQMSAKYFAESAVPFEEVTLKFVEKSERDALRIYLVKKLERFRKKDRTQKTILATWLVEIYLSKLNDLEDMASSAHCTSASNNNGDVETPTNNSAAYYEEQLGEIKDEFKSFLETYSNVLHKATTYKLVASHGRSNELLYYASLIGDSDRVISHWIVQKEWQKALDVLTRQVVPETFYKFSPVLMENAPRETVDVWMRQPNLNPRQLIPSLLRYDHHKISEKVAQNQAIRYLSHVVSTLGNTDPAIHNLLLTLYATQPTDDETALLTFLKNEGREMHYNLGYALRLCSQNGRTQSCVHIYSQMDLYEEAVELALKHHDLELARINADKPEDNDALRKKLWLSIAKHVVQENKDIKTAMEFLQQSDLLKIEDILPFFPDFVLIDDFKDEICQALEDYNIHIEELKTEMDEATKSADSIRLDIRELKSRFALINAVEKCYLCHYPLLTRQFYIFPCQHAFHADCLIDETTKYLSTRQIRRLADLQEQLSRELSSTRNKGTAAPNMGATAKLMSAAAGNIKGVIFPSDAAALDGAQSDPRLGHAEQLKDELDEIVASECALCGDIMIKSIDQPFIADDDADVIASWTV